MKQYLSLIFLFGGCSFAYAQNGIGTTSPNATLEIMGTAGSPATSGSSTNGVLRLQGSQSSNVLDAGNTTSEYSWLQSRNSSNYSQNLPLRINPNGGNVSIGSTTTNLSTLYVNGSIAATGSIRSSAAGQLIHSVYLNETDLGISNSIGLSTTTISNLVTYNYTPKSANSKIYIEFDANCVIGGYGGDRWDSYIYVGSSSIQNNTSYFDPNNGGGGRGNALFPIMGYYSNSSTNTITISIRANRTGGDDLITVSPDMTLIIREISN
jgi:hypothetical protein